MPVAKLHVLPSLCMKGVGLLFARCSKSILLMWSSGIRPMLSGVDVSLAACRLSPPKPKALNRAAIAGAGFRRILKVPGELKLLFSILVTSTGEVCRELRLDCGEVSEGGAAWTDNSADDPCRRRSGSIADPMVMVAASTPIRSTRTPPEHVNKVRSLLGVVYVYMFWRC